jgi:hypothetical protein
MAYAAWAAMAAPMVLGALQKNFGNKNFGDGYDPRLIAQRQQEIADYSNQLAVARGRYKTSLNSMYDTSFAKFMPMAQARLKGQGKGVSGGAYASALARESASNTANMLPSLAQMEQADIRSVDSARANLFGQQFQASTSDMMGRQAQARASEGQMWGAVGQGVGAGIGMWGQSDMLDKYMNYGGPDGGNSQLPGHGQNKLGLDIYGKPSFRPTGGFKNKYPLGDFSMYDPNRG